MAQPTEQFGSEMQFGDVVHVLRQRWKLILTGTVVGAALGFIYVQFEGKSYEAKSVILLSMQDPRNSLRASGLLGDGPTPIGVLSSVIKSRRVEKYVVDKTGMDLKIYRDNLEVKDDSKSNTITIRMSHRPNDLSLKVVQAVVEAIRQTDKDINITATGGRAKMIEDNLAVKRQELDKAEQLLVDFQSTMKAPGADLTPDKDSNSTGVPAGASPQALALTIPLLYRQQVNELELKLGLIQQRMAVIKGKAQSVADSANVISINSQAYQQLRQKLLEKEADAKVARMSLGPDNPKRKQLEADLDISRKQVKDELTQYVSAVEHGDDIEMAKLDADRIVTLWQLEYARPLAKAAPNEALELKRLIAKSTELEAVVQQLTVQYYQAMIDSELDPVHWKVLDEPFLDPEPSGFRPVRTAGFAGLAALLVLCAAVILGDRIQAARR